MRLILSMANEHTEKGATKLRDKNMKYCSFTLFQYTIPNINNSCRTNGTL